MFQDRLMEQFLKQQKDDRMSSVERFRLDEIRFDKLTVKIFDKYEDKELNLSIYELVELLNNVAEPEYNLLKLKEYICDKIDELTDNENYHTYENWVCKND